MSKIKILVVPSDKTAVGNFRSIKPHQYLENKYPDEFFVDIDYSPDLEDIENLKKYDIVHYHKKLGSFADTAENVKKLNDMGIITILDVDDYWTPNSNHPSYKGFMNMNLDKLIINNIKSATNVTTTTDIFASAISKLNKNVSVLENAIDPQEKQYTHPTEPSDRLRIGWLGGSSHKGDINLLKGTVNKLKSERLLDKVQFVLCGFDLSGKTTFFNHKTGQMDNRPIHPLESVWYQYEKVFTDDYKSVSPEYKKFLTEFKEGEFDGVENEPYRRVWTKPITSYASGYSLFDVSLAPLEDNTFNKMKSQLKVIEAGIYGKAIIAQDFGPYKIDLTNAYQKGGNIDSSANALLVDSSKNHKDWHKHIKRLIQNPELVKDLSNNLQETVLSRYTLDIISEKRKALYKSLVDNNKL
jgi:glycosyltransferase involved in cell wall biosynthesis